MMHSDLILVEPFATQPYCWQGTAPWNNLGLKQAIMKRGDVYVYQDQNIIKNSMTVCLNECVTVAV